MIANLINEPTTRRLLILFGIYLVLVFLFGISYWRIYIKDPRSFSFNADILRDQTLNLRSEITRSFQSNSTALDLLRKAKSYLEEGVVPIEERISKWYSLTTIRIVDWGNIRFVRRKTTYGGGIGGIMALGYDLYIEEKGGNSARRSFMLGPSDHRSLSELFDLWITTATNAIERKGSPEKFDATVMPVVWSIFDFMYFSLITQTTVGYGDMLPNSTRIRVLVGTQVIIAYLLLIVVVNVILSS